MLWYNTFNSKDAFTDDEINELIEHCKNYNVETNEDMLNTLIKIKSERLRNKKILKIKSKIFGK